jgi:TetR/AcrR family transcriptional repressor of lmrAB and yxaGH operons
MVSAGEDLLSHRGYGVTLLDVIERADAPRGSIYYHFPNGKQELALEVAAKVRAEVQAFVASVARRIDDPVAFLQRMIEHHRKRLVSSGYVLGCPLMGIVITGDVESPELEAAIAAAFTAWVSSIAAALEGKGLAAAPSRQLATMTVIGVEGAIVLARAQRSGEPFAELSRTIPALVRALSPEAVA